MARDARSVIVAGSLGGDRQVVAFKLSDEGITIKFQNAGGGVRVTYPVMALRIEADDAKKIETLFDRWAVQESNARLDEAQHRGIKALKNLVVAQREANAAVKLLHSLSISPDAEVAAGENVVDLDELFMELDRMENEGAPPSDG